MHEHTIDTGFTAVYDLVTGISNEVDVNHKFLSQMRGLFADEAALEAAIAREDAVIYDTYPIKPVPHGGDLSSGTTLLYPGKIGDEYFFTKGHYHAMLMTSEVYFGLSGEGLMLLENKAGDWKLLPVVPGATVYAPKGWAHRMINTGSVPLVTYFTLRSDAGQDFSPIEKHGYAKIIVERNGRPVAIDNPRRR